MFVRTANLPLFEHIYNDPTIFIYQISFWEENRTKKTTDYCLLATAKELTKKIVCAPESKN